MKFRKIITLLLLLLFVAITMEFQKKAVIYLKESSTVVSGKLELPGDFYFAKTIIKRSEANTFHINLPLIK